MLEPIGGLDAAFLALETSAAWFHVGAVLELDATAVPPTAVPTTRFPQVSAMVADRLPLVPQLRQRAVRMPLDLLPPVWVDDPNFCLGEHLRRARLPVPGGRRELDEFVADFLGRPLAPDRPLWEMVLVEGFEGERAALVAKLHHAILDGVSGASVMAAFLDLSAHPRTVAEAEGTWDPPPLPSAVELIREAMRSLVHQPEAMLEAAQASVVALAGLNAQYRRLSGEGEHPPPLPFSAPRTSLNGALSTGRRFATVSVAQEDIELVRGALGPAAGGATFNDVVLCAVGTAADRLLRRRGEVPDRPLVALVPVSTRRRGGRERRPDGGGAETSPQLGNQLSGMLVAVAPGDLAPEDRLAAVVEASRTAKEQERVVGGRLLEDIARAAPHALTSWSARWASAVHLFDLVPPLFNLVVSTVPGPDAALWCAGSEVTAVFPAGPVAHGVGLNVTSMTACGVVHFGLVGCQRLVPDLDDLAALLDEAVGELVAAARSPSAGVPGARPLPEGQW